MKMTDVDRIKDNFSNGIYVKVSYKDEIRKFKILDQEKPYDDILNVLSHQYDLDTYNNGNIRLSYIDDDLDEITVSSNREVVDALTSFTKNGCCIKLKIKNYTDESGSESGEMQSAQEYQAPRQTQLQEAIKPSSPEHKVEPDLQNEIDNVISGVRGSRNFGEEPVIVPNIFTSFQGKVKRQFEIEEGRMVVCRLCPAGRTMAPTIDLNIIKSHTKSDIHVMALTYHVLGEWPTMPSLPPFKLEKTADLLKERSWRTLDNTAAHLLAAKYHHHLNKPVGQRRKRTSFSPATTLSLEKFANNIQWKRGESEKINEFAQKHGLTFYQVKVWMNNHRPRKSIPHHPQGPGHYLSNSVGSFYNVDHAREINKVIAALEEPLKMKTDLHMNIPTSMPITSSFGLSASALNSALNTSSLGLNTALNTSSLGLNTALNTSSLGLNTALNTSSLGLNTALNSSSLGLSLQSSLNIPTTLGLFNTPPASTLINNGGSPSSPKTSPPPIVTSPFFTSRYASSFSLPQMTSSQSLPVSLANDIASAISEHKVKIEGGSPDLADKMDAFPGLTKSSHPLSLDTVSLDSAFRPPSFTSNLHSIFTRQESTSSGS